MAEGGTLWVATTEIISGGDVNNPILNVYTLCTEDTGAVAANGISNWIETEWFPFIRPIIWEGAYISKLSVINQFDLVDFVVDTFLPSQYPGLGVGDPLPVFNSAGILLQRSSRAVRNGYKRYSPVLESQQSNGAWNSGMLSALTSLGTAITDGISINGFNDNVWLSIVQRIKTVNIQTGKAKYELPTTAGQLEWYIPLGFEVKTKVGTQDTRKR